MSVRRVVIDPGRWGVVVGDRGTTTVEDIPRTVPHPARVATAAVLLALLVLAAACSSPTDPAASSESSGSADSDETTTSTTNSATGPEGGTDADRAEDDATGGGDSDADGGEADGALAVDAVRELLAGLDGQLAIGNGPVVAVARADGQRYIELDGGRTNLASQPTWSADGTKLIWSSVSALAQEARVQLFDSEGVADGDPLTTNVPGPPVFYFQWRSDGDEALYLRNSIRRPTVEAGVLTPGGPARWMADGDPFFVAWAPNEPIIAAHVAEERLALFDPAGAAAFGAADEGEPDGASEPGSDDPVVGDDLVDGGGFSSPAWLDDETLVAVVSGALSAVDIRTGSVEPLVAVDGPVQFVLSPDRSRVALQVATDPNDEDDVLEVAVTPIQEGLADGSLIVVDVADRSVDVVTERSVVAWEWSPDSTKLAWLELDGPISRRRGRWRFWSADGPVVGDARSPLLQLSVKELVNYFPFFAQYSFSLHRWSPDSSAFALVGSVNGRNGIWIHLVDVPAAPALVAPGDLVSWGFGPTPSPDAGRSPA
ncbi:MAG: hypothetical protein OES24_12115 [Acidimicrobiia bacterium]|nr:hypothetical protein [Acidimicrobiia bacterium]